jgi:predicted unusual protein kinase regulating ubiquinone biosynthesis (AarF/ABC1/UbiB family)
MAFEDKNQNLVLPTNNANGNGNHSTNGRTALVLNGNGAKSISTNEHAKSLPNEVNEREEKKPTWRGYLRFAQIARVLGTLVFYLFLNDYDIRYKFEKRMVERRMEEARKRGRMAAFNEWSRNVDLWVLDKFIRVVRSYTFRGVNGSKEARLAKQGKWLLESLIKLGPTFIKIGQALGTRADLLPLPYIIELEKLQDKVPPYPTAEAFERIEKELGRAIQEAYAEIDTEPIAAASLGQVYRARLHNGTEVAVKVQRPNLKEQIEGDIAILESIARFANRLPELNENADWEGMLREFDHTIHEEIDYAQEARNADRFRENFKSWRAVRVPKIYWTHTTKHIITMDFIRGTKVVNLDELRARQISPVKVNRLLIKTYLKQLLEDGFFHADPHPGNLLVMDSGHLAFFDFGMTGKITPHLQSKIVDAFFHVIGKDVEGISQDLIDLNFLKPGADPDLVRPVVETLLRLHLNKKLGEVNFKELTYDLADVMYDYPFRLPSNFTYIMRALMTLEGIGIITDPEFNFFDTAKPYAKEFMLKREGKQFRKLVLDKLTGRDDGSKKIEWSKMWKLAKMAVKMYLEK